MSKKKNIQKKERFATRNIILDPKEKHYGKK